MRKLWSEIVRQLEPYVPGEQPKDRKYIKLNTNENPYPPSPRVLEAMKQAVNDDIRLYPSPTCDGLRQTIADYHNLSKDQVFVGNGSDELLAFVFLAFFNPASPIVFPDITYSFYPVYAGLFDIDYRVVPLTADFSIPVEEFFKPNGGIIFPNPNAPTGKGLELAALESVLRHNMKSIVVVDEAYVDFGATSAVPLIDKYPNLLVVQTMSKSRSLAGLRVGFALGHKDLTEALERVKNSFNSYTLDRIALAGAQATFEDEEYFQSVRNKVMATREDTTVKLQELGFKVVPSQANFIFISHPTAQASDIFRKLRDKGVLVRYFNKPRINNHLRVTIGSDEEMRFFFQTVKEILP